ncbi:MAG: indolepyruvate oxidoreductase subunit beta [Deltaproteobacteria bacterium]|jgi:indolepyruvate ferredoxin oxidoreductase beta subunit|nr:indolepyruvate oxidoreductase subunit beta [Deltaproteobacteria bacterium]
MTKVKNILLVGVGGQGTILVGRILSNGLLETGYDVKMSEIHGMAQRGGSVSNQVRYGQKVYSPIIDKGQADILVSFETMEALRWLPYLNPSGQIVVNDFRIPSAPMLSGQAQYPEGILEALSAKVPTTVIKAGDIAESLGNSRAMNVVLFGALVKKMGLEAIDWEKQIKNNVKPAFIDLNLKAYQAGYQA